MQDKEMLFGDKVSMPSGNILMHKDNLSSHADNGSTPQDDIMMHPDKGSRHADKGTIHHDKIMIVDYKSKMTTGERKTESRQRKMATEQLCRNDTTLRQG